MVNWQIFG